MNRQLGVVLISAGCFGLGRAVPAQSPAAKAALRDSLVFEFPSGDVVAPARYILDLADKLQLSESQTSKLAALERAQTTDRSRAAAAFMRAEADLLDAIRLNDLPLRRAALERRAKIAIDAEMTRLQAEQDTRAQLTADQRSTLMKISPMPPPIPSPMSEVSEWRAIVSPPPITRLVRTEAADSGEVRISVTPNYADIFVDSYKVGTGRKFLLLPVGSHELKLHAIGCVDVVLQIQVERGPAQVVPPQTLSCSR